MFISLKELTATVGNRLVNTAVLVGQVESCIIEAELMHSEQGWVGAGFPEQVATGVGFKVEKEFFKAG